MRIEPKHNKSAYSYALQMLERNPKVSPMQAINTFCNFNCPYRSTGQDTCQEQTCPLGLIKYRMDIVRTQNKHSGAKTFVDTRKHKGDTTNAVKRASNEFLTAQQIKDLETLGAKVSFDEYKCSVLTNLGYTVSFDYDAMIEHGFVRYYNEVFDKSKN